MSYYDDFSFTSGFPSDTTAGLPAVTPAPPIAPALGRINTQQPFDLSGISQYIGSYSSPEQAEFQTPLRSQDFLRGQYQDITGDFTGDPFNAASTARTRAAVNAIAAARQAQDFAPTGTFGQLGMQPPTVAGPKGAPTPALPMSPDTHEEYRAAASAALQANAARRILAEGEQPSLYGTGAKAPQREFSPTGQPLFTGEEYMPPLIGAGDHIQDMLYRSSVAGVRPEAEKILGREGSRAYAINPHAAETFLQVMDPNTKQPKIVSGSDLQPLAYTNEFQKLQATDPAKAKRLYNATYPNRNYDNDIEATTQRRKQTQDFADEAIKDVRLHGQWDSVLGQFVLSRQVQDPTNPGQYKTVKEPLPEITKQLLKQKGIQSVFPDVDTSGLTAAPMVGTKGVNASEVLTPQEDQTLRQAVFQDQQQNTGKPLAQSVDDMSKKLYREAQGANQPPVGQLSVMGHPFGGTSMGEVMRNFDRRDFTTAAATNPAISVENVARGAANIPFWLTNMILKQQGVDYRMPYIPSRPYVPGAPPMTTQPPVDLNAMRKLMAPGYSPTFTQ